MSLQWLSLVGAIWLQSINGTNSNFPAYSSELKRLLSLSQLQLNNLAFASDAGKLLGFLSGIAASRLPLPVVLLAGSLLGLAGYGIQYLFLSGHLPPNSLSFPLLFFLTVLAGNSICWINTVCYIITIQNFPFDRIVAVGLTTSYIGLSAEIYTDLVNVFFPSSPSSPMETAKAYLLLNSVCPLVVCVLGAPIVRCTKNGASKRLGGGFMVMFVITIGTGIFAVVSSFGKIFRGLPAFAVVVGMGVFLLAPMVVPLVESVMERFQKKCWLRKDGRVYDVGVVESGGGEGRKEAEESGGGEVIVAVEEVGVKEMVKRVEFWLYFMVYLFGGTLGLVYLNNLGQIAESRGFKRTSSLVSLSSSFGFFGRLIPSLLAYIFPRSKFMGSTPASIATIMAPMSASFFLLLNKTTLCLYISTAVIGLCTGAITSIAVSTTTELFGAKNFSVNHNIVVANIPIGSFLFGNAAALLYRSKINAEDDGRCMGTDCYQMTFVIWGFLCLFGSFLSVILYVRTKKMYAQRL